MSKRLVFPRDKQGFLLLAYPRCGSHMLQSALNAHPDVTCYDEVFNPAVVPMAGRPSISQRLLQFWDGPLTGVIAHAYIGWKGRRGLRKAKPIFTKLFLRLPADTTVICLQRRNLLRRHVSHLAASRSGEWLRKKSESPLATITKVTVDPSRLKRDVAHTRAIYRTVGVQFINTYSVTYEQLCADLPKYMQCIYQHLGADPAKCIAPEVDTARLGMLPLREQVTNYAELKKQFAGTDLEVYFDE